MDHLVVTAHPRIKSFNSGVAVAYTAELTESGHHVCCRNLYSIGFNPVLSARDMSAMASGRLPRDIRAELRAIQIAEVITLISPLWWRGFPAILKGYIDRVFTAGAGYLSNGNSKGRLSGRKAVIITTSEATIDELKRSGTLRDLMTDHSNIMDYCGIELVGQLYLGGVSSSLRRSDGEKNLETVRRFVRRTFK